MNLAALRQQLERTTELDLPCQFCGASVGVPYFTPRNRTVPPHDGRRTAMLQRKAELYRLIDWEERIANSGARTSTPAGTP